LSLYFDLDRHVWSWVVRFMKTLGLGSLSLHDDFFFEIKYCRCATEAPPLCRACRRPAACSCFVRSPFGFSLVFSGLQHQEEERLVAQPSGSCQTLTNERLEFIHPILRIANSGTGVLCTWVEWAKPVSFLLSTAGSGVDVVPQMRVYEMRSWVVTRDFHKLMASRRLDLRSRL
jgi:hypothetical protein